MFNDAEKSLVREILSDQWRHVHAYKIKKKSSKGKIKYRQIIAPSEMYKDLQKKIKYYFETRNVLKISDQSFAWVPGKGRIECVLPHIKKNYVLEADISDYFGSIKSSHLFGLFVYNEEIPNLLNLLEINLDDFVNLLTIQLGNSERFLPQGFATSPMIANAIRYDIDARMKKLADENNWDYTTYGDNLFISGESVPKSTVDTIDDLFKIYGFSINKLKSKVRPYYQQQKILGIVVNEKLSIDKDYYHGLIENLIESDEVDLSLMGKINQLRINDNPRNYQYIKRLAGNIHGIQI